MLTPPVTTDRSDWSPTRNAKLSITVRGKDMASIYLLEWPAMVITVVAAWMVASERKFNRNWGFWLFLVSNALWIIWGVDDHAYGLICLQISLAGINIRGTYKNRVAQRHR